MRSRLPERHRAGHLNRADHLTVIKFLRKKCTPRENPVYAYAVEQQLMINGWDAVTGHRLVLRSVRLNLAHIGYCCSRAL